jgi:flagella basal body P-ring formation protein FlgA
MAMGVFLAMASLGPGCFAAARDLPAGAALTASDLAPVACQTAAKRAPLRYDRDDGVPVTSAAVAAGTYLGHVLPIEDARVARGDTLTLRSSAGPVTIERAVVAMQPGRSGGRVFVRDSEGKVFAAPLAVEAGR